MKNVVLFASVGVACGLLFVNLYTSLVDAKSWGSDIPTSIATTREYFKAVNPANFFRIFSPVNQILALFVLILFWRSSPYIRFCLGAAFVMYLLADVFTFGYFYPRNDIMFKTAQLTDTTLLRKAWSEWSMMNWVRSSIVLVGVVFSFLSLHKIYSLPER
jgi:type III secretory pathway component EscU